MYRAPRAGRVVKMAKGKSPGSKGGADAGARAGKPKHSNDANRPNKSVGGQRDAATVRASKRVALGGDCIIQALLVDGGA